MVLRVSDLIVKEVDIIFGKSDKFGRKSIYVHGKSVGKISERRYGLSFQTTSSTIEKKWKTFKLHTKEEFMDIIDKIINLKNIKQKTETVVEPEVVKVEPEIIKPEVEQTDEPLVTSTPKKYDGDVIVINDDKKKIIDNLRKFSGQKKCNGCDKWFVERRLNGGLCSTCKEKFRDQKVLLREMKKKPHKV